MEPTEVDSDRMCTIYTQHVNKLVDGLVLLKAFQNLISETLSALVLDRNKAQVDPTTAHLLMAHPRVETTIEVYCIQPLMRRACSS